jgi:[glutamine synthetase] adenylyltransferase / [glutamine synthetase]-adenylyl-L-tyrosine phosphorylase
MERARRFSGFVAGASLRRKNIVDLWVEGGFPAALPQVEAIEATTGPACWRRRRDALMLLVGLADLAGELPLETVVALLSEFADQALQAAIATAIESHVKGAEARGFAAIALGKHGSRELNYSSDIDPIFIYDPETLPHRAREEPADAAVRIARRVVDLLQTRDADGFVFRVDLRLRPASEATPIAIPVDAALSHYESSALAWERAAFIRGRAAAGDVALGDEFLAALTPFVWRRSLDYGAIDEIRALTRAIRDHHSGQRFGPGFDVKRGRGGIREIEFFAQAHQLIHGGREPALRIGATMPALDALAGHGRLDHDDAETLKAAYRRLRTVEHRLQLVDDRQTHRLPLDPDALDAVARLDGRADAAALLASIEPHTTRVEHLYDALDNRSGVESDDRGIADFKGFADPADAERRVARWRGGSVRAVRSAAAIASFEALLPDLLRALMAARDPDAALARFDRLLDGLSTGVNLFRLLQAEPLVRAALVDILVHAPPLAEALVARPALLDRLVDRSAFEPLPPTPDLAGQMQTNAGTLEDALDRVRVIVAEHRFALGVQIVEGRADPIEVGRGYARLADAALATVATRVVADFEARHGRVPGSELVVLALGRLGGGLLTHASDLDLIYLFTGDHTAESDGAKPLGATHYYNRLGQRLTGALSAPTSAGALYELDTRLRPSGAQGPLVVSLESFERYQREAAWTWEHMALTRARPVFGSDTACDKVRGVIASVLGRPRTPETLAADVRGMRADMDKHKPARGELDVKLGAGGLVDLEFTVHYMQLRHGAGMTPDMTDALGKLVAENLIVTALPEAHALLTRLLVTLRLVSPDFAPVDAATQRLVADACQAESWDQLLDMLAGARQTVARQFGLLGKD